MKLARQTLVTPIGELHLLAQGRTLLAAAFADERVEALRLRHFEDAAVRGMPAGGPASEAFEAYFQGDWDALVNVPMRTNGTPFQEQVWTALKRIPAGYTVSYSELAIDIGRPDAVRAVALANSMNPVAIAIPCHRVIGKNGALTGYADGLARKAWLLDHEQPRRWSSRSPNLELELELQRVT